MHAQAMGPCYLTQKDLLEHLTKLLENDSRMANNSRNHAQANASIARMLSIAGVCAGVLIAIALGFYLSRSIGGSLSGIIDTLSAGSEDLTAASSQVAQSSQQMAKGATDQAASLEKTSSALEEMAAMTRQNADNAGTANNIMAEAKTTVEDGVQSMSRMSGAIEMIKSSTSETAKIIKTIDEIAFQTNLLALNAAVEAARAGEAGKGFAVVAEEVRNLARRSAEAAKSTAELIEGALKNADSGVAVTHEVAKAFEAIQTSALKAAALIGEIAAASKEQSQGIDQITTSVSEMDRIVQQNAAIAEESASASEELSSEAEEVNAAVERLISLVGRSGAAGPAHSAAAVATVHAGNLQRPPAAALNTPQHRIAAPAGSDDLMPWSDALSVKVECIDEQHKILVGMINDLYRAMKTGKADTVLQSLLDGLIDYTNKHFSFEEGLLEKTHYRGISAHKKLHVDLVTKVVKNRDDFKAGKMVIGSDIMKFLKDWLINHIMKVDMSYSDHLRRNGY